MPLMSAVPPALPPEVRAFVEQFAELYTDNAARQETIDSLREENSELKIIGSNREKRLVEMRGVEDDLRDRIQEQAGEIADLKATVEARDCSLAHANDRIKDLEERLTVAVSETCEALTGQPVAPPAPESAPDPDAANAALASAKAKAAMLDSHLAIERAARAAVDKRFAELQEENTRLLGEVNNLKRDRLTGKEERPLTRSDVVEIVHRELISRQAVTAAAGSKE